MDNNLNNYTPVRKFELLNTIFEVFIIATIVSIYTNSVPSFHTFNFFKGVTYFVFNLNFILLLYLFPKIRYGNNYNKNIIPILIIISIYVLLAYILTITTEADMQYIKNNNFFKNSIILYITINIFIIFTLCYFKYTNKIHRYNIRIEHLPFNIVDYKIDHISNIFNNLNILYIIFLYIIPLLLFIYLKNFFVANFIIVTPFLLFSTFLILFTVFIPKLRGSIKNNIESTLETLESTYFED